MDIKCPKCKKKFEVAGGAAGQQILAVCPRCGDQFNHIVPQQAMTAIAPASSNLPATTPEQVAIAETVPTHFCQQCGQRVEDGKAYCPECGAPQMPNANQNQQPVLTGASSTQTDYTGPIGAPLEQASCWAIGCSFLIPIVGLILYFVQKDKVENAQSYLWAAGAGFVIGLILQAI